MKKFKKGERVKYYGTYNEYSEVSWATVKREEWPLLLVELDASCNDYGVLCIPGTRQWAHVNQVRRLKSK